MSKRIDPNATLWGLVVEIINEEFFVYGQFLTETLLHQIIEGCSDIVVDDQPQA